MKVVLQLLTVITALVSVYSNCVCNEEALVCKKSSNKDARQMFLQAPDCPNARIVNIRNNHIGSVPIPKEFIRKHNNATFWADGNEFTTLDWLIGWRGPGLSFHDNFLTDLDPKLLGDNLEYLYGNQNSLTRLDLSDATKLRRIWLMNDGLEEIIYPNTCVLDYIDLEGNNFNTVHSSILRCKRLTAVYLNRNLLYEIPKSIIQLLLLRPSEWENGDHNYEIKVDLRNNKIPSDHVIEVFKRFTEEQHRLSITSFPNCECATVRTIDRKYAAVFFCISSMCGDNGYSRWDNI